MQTQQDGTAEAPSFHPAAFILQGMFALANETEREVARTLGLNLTDYRALSVLAQVGPVTVGKLAEELGASAATTTAIVSRLEAHAYAVRLRSAEDRRHVRVNVTPAASRDIMDLMRPLVAATSTYLSALPAADQVVVEAFLRAAAGQMQAHLNALSQKDAR
jgi:DNA-binding MarR family transcriptional regulator